MGLALLPLQHVGRIIVWMSGLFHIQRLKTDDIENEVIYESLDDAGRVVR